jgi:hypothetical protein
MPLAAEASRRVRTFDYQREIGDFRFWLDHWSPQSLAGDGRAINEECRGQPLPADYTMQADGIDFHPSNWHVAYSWMQGKALQDSVSPQNVYWPTGGNTGPPIAGSSRGL